MCVYVYIHYIHIFTIYTYRDIYVYIHDTHIRIRNFSIEE